MPYVTLIGGPEHGKKIHIGCDCLFFTVMAPMPMPTLRPFTGDQKIAPDTRIFTIDYRVCNTNPLTAELVNKNWFLDVYRTYEEVCQELALLKMKGETS